MMIYAQNNHCHEPPWSVQLELEFLRRNPKQRAAARSVFFFPKEQTKKPLLSLSGWNGTVPDRKVPIGQAIHVAPGCQEYPAMAGTGSKTRETTAVPA